MTVATDQIQLPQGRKPCAECGEEKLLSEFHFQRYKPLAGQRPTDAPRGRYRPNCKVCQREYMRQRRINLIEKNGTGYLEEETKRVRDFYATKEGRLDLRRAVDRARYSAYANLRDRHLNEYQELLAQARRQEGVPDDYLE